METCKNCGKPIHKISLLNNGEIWLHEGEISVCRRTYAEPLVVEEKRKINPPHWKDDKD